MMKLAETLTLDIHAGKTAPSMGFDSQGDLAFHQNDDEAERANLEILSCQCVENLAQITTVPSNPTAGAAPKTR